MITKKHTKRTKEGQRARTPASQKRGGNGSLTTHPSPLSLRALRALGDEKKRTPRLALSATAMLEEEPFRASLSTYLQMVGPELPTDLQWMPPGTHTITCEKGGKPHTVTMKVDEQTAHTMQACLADLIAAANAGTEDLPYIDFNHDDKEAAGHVTAFFWGGEDPKSGGVRAKIDWTHAGAAAVKGKSYRRFSPSFFPDSKGRVIGAPVNMGGLVNRAAFRRIAPVAAKDGDEQTNQTTTETTMKNLMAHLAKLGLVKDADADEASAISQVSAAHAALTLDRTTSFDKKTGALEAKDDKNVIDPAQAKALTERNATLEAELKASQEEVLKARATHATSIVEQACLTGRIPAQNTELKALWIEKITADPAMAKLLPEPVNALGARLVNGLPQLVKGSATEEAKAAAKAKLGESTGFNRILDACNAEHASNGTTKS